MDFGIAGVTAITVIVYMVGLAAHASALNNKWIPVLCAASGAALGICGLYIMPAFPAGDLLSAAAVGIVSGLAATGANQMFKQMKEGGCDG